MKEIKINSTILFLFFSFLIIAFKLILSNFYYPDEDLLLKTIFDIESLQFIPIIKSYSEFDFSPIFELKDNFDYKNLAFPYLSLFLHSFSLKLIGLSSFFFFSLSTTEIASIGSPFSKRSTIHDAMRIWASL